MFFGSQGATAKPASQPEATSRKADENRTNCLPVTLRMLEDALSQRAGDDELQIHGMPHAMLHIVGTVESLTRQTHSLELSINDGTGRIKARYFVNGSEDLKDLQLGKYVSAVGQARSAPTVHFAVTFMSLIQSPDEVSYHMIEAAHAALKLDKDRTPDTPAAKKKVGAEISPEKSGDPSELTPSPVRSVQPQLTEAAPAAPAKLDAAGLQAAVLKYIQTAGEGREEGLDTDAVVKYFGSSPAAEVKGTLAKLVDLGDVFNTIDEEHFSAL